MMTPAAQTSLLLSDIAACLDRISQDQCRSEPESTDKLVLDVQCLKELDRGLDELSTHLIGFRKSLAFQGSRFTVPRRGAAGPFNKAFRRLMFQAGE